MKKSIVIVLAVLMIITMGITSFAAGAGNGQISSNSGSVNADVYGQ